MSESPPAVSGFRAVAISPGIVRNKAMTHFFCETLGPLVGTTLATTRLQR
jgi:hypothetical protein